MRRRLERSGKGLGLSLPWLPLRADRGGHQRSSGEAAARDRNTTVGRSWWVERRPSADFCPAHRPDRTAASCTCLLDVITKKVPLENGTSCERGRPSRRGESPLPPSSFTQGRERESRVRTYSECSASDSEVVLWRFGFQPRAVGCGHALGSFRGHSS